MTKNKKFENLTKKQIKDLMDKYYGGESVKKLIEEYNIDTHTTKLYTLFPPIEVDEICIYCNINMVKNRQQRTNVHALNDSYCPACGHKSNEFCDCINCLEKREHEIKRMAREKKELIHKLFSPEKKKKIDITTLKFKDKVILGAVLRIALSEDMSYIEALDSIDEKLSPTQKCTEELIGYLLNKDIIIVSPMSDLDAFVETTQNIEASYFFNLHKVQYLLNFEYDIDIIYELINPKNLLDGNCEDALDLWIKIGREECIEYLYFRMKKVGFDFTAGEKTISVFSELLNNYSVSQVYGIIFKKISGASRYYLEENISKRQAANSVIGNCQRYGEKAKLEKWDIVKYSRVKDCSQSMISEFFFNRVLEIGDNGFNATPNTFWLKGDE